MAMTEAQREALPHDLVILNDMAEADRRGDAETYRKLRSQLEVPVWALKALKRAGLPTTFARPSSTRRSRTKSLVRDGLTGRTELDAGVRGNPPASRRPS